MSELRECPFCGNADISLKREDYDSGTIQTVYYFCHICEAETGYVDIPDEICLPDSILEAKDKWNTRPLEDSLRAENAKLRGSLVSISNMVYEDSLDERNNLAVEIRRIVEEALK